MDSACASLWRRTLFDNQKLFGRSFQSVKKNVPKKKRLRPMNPSYSWLIPPRFCDVLPTQLLRRPHIQHNLQCNTSMPKRMRCFWEYQSDTSINDIFRLSAWLHAKTHVNDVLVENEDLGGPCCFTSVTTRNITYQ